jgi:hypothetical protein
MVFIWPFFTATMYVPAAYAALFLALVALGVLVRCTTGDLQFILPCTKVRGAAAAQAQIGLMREPGFRGRAARGRLAALVITALLGGIVMTGGLSVAVSGGWSGNEIPRFAERSFVVVLCMNAGGVALHLVQLYGLLLPKRLPTAGDPWPAKPLIPTVILTLILGGLGLVAGIKFAGASVSALGDVAWLAQPALAALVCMIAGGLSFYLLQFYAGPLDVPRRNVTSTETTPTDQPGPRTDAPSGAGRMG